MAVLVKVASSAIRLDNPAESRGTGERERTRWLGVVEDVQVCRDVRSTTWLSDRLQ